MTDGRRRVVVTRPEGRGDGLAERLRRSGARVDLRPTIAFDAPSDRAARDRAAGRVGEYRFVVVTSPTAVGFLIEAVRAAGGTPLDGARVAAVGPGTARAFEDAGVRPAIVASRADADGLAGDLAPRIRAGDRVLVVRPESGARDVLPRALEERGARVDAVPFYRTVAAPACADLARRLVAGEYDVAVFSSPSTFARLLEGAGDAEPRVLAALRSLRTVAIGPVTASAMAARGVDPDAVAAAPTDDAVAAAVESVW